MQVRKFLGLSARLAFLVVLSAQPVSAEALKTRLAQNLSPISGIAIVAKAKGFFDKEGLDVEVSNFTSGKQALGTVIGGGADIATTAEAPVTAAAMSGQPIAFVAGMEYSDVKTLASTASRVKTRADLRGKKIAYTAGTGSEVYTAQLLKSAGLTAKDVTLINLRPQEMLPALASGGIDAFDTWEPMSPMGKSSNRLWCEPAPLSAPFHRNKIWMTSLNTTSVGRQPLLTVLAFIIGMASTQACAITDIGRRSRRNFLTRAPQCSKR